MESAIRRATLDDLWALRTMWQQMVDEQHVTYPAPLRTDPDVITRYFAEGLAGEPFARLIVPVVTVADRLVGFASGEVLTRPTGSPVHYGFLTWVWVEPPHRGLGLGRQLLRMVAETFAKIPTLTHAQLVAYPGNDAWTSRGWTPCTIEHQIRLDDWLARLTGNGHTKETVDGLMVQ